MAQAPPGSRHTPAILWLVTGLAAVFLWLPLSGIGEGLASVPHTGMGCDAASGPICGNQGEALWASAGIAVFVGVLYLGAVAIVCVGNRGRTRSVRCWPALLTLVGYAAAVFLSSFLVGRS